MKPRERIDEVEKDKRLKELEREVAKLREEVEELRKQNGKLRLQLDAWKRGFSERRKRRTSRPERTRASPKTPGRKLGHTGAKRPVPEQIHGEEHHAAPATCTCGGDVQPTEEIRTTVVQDVPPVVVTNTRHVAHVGVCTRCQKKVSSPLPGDVSVGKSVVEVSVGPHLQAMAVGLRFEQKVALGKIGRFFRQWFGVSVSPGGLSHMLTRLRKRSGSVYEEILQHVRRAAVVGGDETGLRQSGKLVWVWLLRTGRASLFFVHKSRGREPFEHILGDGFVGIFVTDFYAVYTRRGDLNHAYCGAHLIREAKQVAELQPSPLTASFRDRVRAFYAAGEAAQKSGEPGAKHGALVRLGQLANAQEFSNVPDIARLQARIRLHKVGITRFLDDPDIPWHNNHTEGDIRDIARLRAVSGGTRSDNGSANVGHWMSITQTRYKNGLPLGPFVVGLYNAHLNKTPFPSVFAL